MPAPASRSSRVSDAIALPSDYRIQRFYGNEQAPLLAAIGRLRFEVWSSEPHGWSGPSEDQSVLDERDSQAHHFAILDGAGRPVASARLVIVDAWKDHLYAQYYAPLLGEQPVSPAAILSRTVVDPEHRRRGLGAHLLWQRTALAEALGARTAVSEIPPHRDRGFTNQGFTRLSSNRPGYYVRSLEFYLVSRPLCATEGAGPTVDRPGSSR